MTLEDSIHIPLSNSYLCPDCDSIGNPRPTAAPAGASTCYHWAPS